MLRSPHRSRTPAPRSGLVQPTLDVFHPIPGGQQLVANNDNWGSLAASDLSAYGQLTAAVGAFAFDPGSNDAGLILSGPPASGTAALYSVQVRGVQSGTGVALAEIYDAAFVHTHLVNLSARARVGTGENLLIAGFVVAGNQPLKLLLRAVGPTLASQGVAQPLTNPKLTLYDVNGHEIHNNDQWNDARNLADLRTATTATGAFPLIDGSNDAAMLETLDPGVYTAHVTSVDGSSGVALVEIFEAP